MWAPNPPPNLGQLWKKTTIKTHDKDLTLEIETNNQPQIQLQVIHDTAKVLSLKDNSQLLSASSKPKSNWSGNQIFLNVQAEIHVHIHCILSDSGRRN